MDQYNADMRKTVGYAVVGAVAVIGIGAILWTCGRAVRVDDIP
jgi:hypothetical protein